jgi:hypothetical protein
LEDVATGSAAGVVGAYALKHGLVRSGEAFVLRQEYFMGRPSGIILTPFGARDDIERVTVAGELAFVGKATLVKPRYPVEMEASSVANCDVGTLSLRYQFPRSPSSVILTSLSDWGNLRGFVTQNSCEAAAGCVRVW